MKKPVTFLNERLKVILANVLFELYDKSFDCNYDEFEKYCKLEIGIADAEMEYFKEYMKLPEEERESISDKSREELVKESDCTDSDFNICDICTHKNGENQQDIIACSKCQVGVKAIKETIENTKETK